MENKKILVTGAAGMLGSKFCKWLVDNTKHKVAGFDNLSEGYLENILDLPIVFYEKDFRNLKDTKKVFEEFRPDIVFHFGAFCCEGLSPFVRQYTYENNIIGTGNIITSCIEYNVEHIVFTSSMSRYGDYYNAPLDEKMIPFGMDPYAISKVASEYDLEIAWRQHQLNFTTIIPHNIISDNVNLTSKFRGVLAIWCRQLLENQNPTIYGDGNQKRAFTDTNDILDSIYKAYINPLAHREVINLGGINEVSINEACKLLIDIAKKDMFVKYPLHLEPRFEAKNAWCTWEKSVKLLDFEHKTPLKTTIQNLWDWAKVEYPKRKLKPKMYSGDFELNKGLYEYWK